MADVKISQLTAISSFVGDEMLEVVQSGNSYKGSPSQLLTYTKSAIGIATLTSGRMPVAGSGGTLLDSDIRVSSGNYGLGVAPAAKWHVFRGSTNGIIQQLEGGATSFSLITEHDASGSHMYTNLGRAITFGANSSLTDLQITTAGKIRLGVVPTSDNANTSLLARNSTSGEIEIVSAAIFQPLDDELTALASTNSSADALPYFTGAGTATTTAFRSFGRTLAGAATAADARTSLGLVIGTNVQAFDAELAAIAGLTSAADRVPYFTGSGTAALATFTAFGRSLVDDANAAAALTTLGVSAFIQTLLDDADAATARTTLGFSGTNDYLPKRTSSGYSDSTLYVDGNGQVIIDNGNFNVLTSVGTLELRGSDSLSGDGDNVWIKGGSGSGIDGNVVIGQFQGDLLGAENVLYLTKDDTTEPSGAPGSGIMIYPYSNGSNHRLAWYQSKSVEAIGTFTATHKVNVRINGVEYWIQLDPV
jgi:hypothetical protein